MYPQIYFFHIESQYSQFRNTEAFLVDLATLWVRFVTERLHFIACEIFHDDLNILEVGMFHVFMLFKYIWSNDFDSSDNNKSLM